MSLALDGRKKEKAMSRGKDIERDGLGGAELDGILRRTAERLAGEGHEAGKVSDKRILAALGVSCAALLPDVDAEAAAARVRTEESVAEVRRLMFTGEVDRTIAEHAPDPLDALADPDPVRPAGAGSGEERGAVDHAREAAWEPAAAGGIGYAIREYRVIPTAALEPGYDAGRFAADADDREAVRASMDDVGLLQPLIVTARGDGGYTVLDGLGRLDAAKRREDEDGNPDPVPDLPCLVVDCGDPLALALHINSAGRKRSTGSRVLCYLLAHREQVMEAWRYTTGEAKCHMTPGSKRGSDRNQMPERLKPWGVKEVAKRLGVSNKDVQAAMELIACRETETYPSRATAGEYTSGQPIEDVADLEALNKAYAGVICGRTPVRRWAAAFAGRATTEDKGKADTRHWSVAERGATMLRTAFEAWPQIDWPGPAKRAEVEQKLASALALLPECGRAALIGLIPQAWPGPDKAALARALGAKAK
jgi:hypothetical protein